MDIVHVCIQYSNLQNTDFMYFQVFSNIGYIQWLNLLILLVLFLGLFIVEKLNYYP
jgi:hypothetical protein